MREWRELHHQLAQTAIEMGLTTKEAAFRRPPEVKQLTSSENAGDQDLSAKLKQNNWIRNNTAPKSVPLKKLTTNKSTAPC